MTLYEETTIRITHCWPVLNIDCTHRTEPLNDRCFDLKHEFNYSELSHFALQTSIEQKKSKRERQIIVRLLFHLKVKSQKGGRPAGRLGMFFLSSEDESQATLCC